MDELKALLDEQVEDRAESHIEAWKGRYFLKGRKEVREDLYVNHDPSLEFESVERALGRSLTDEEKDIVEERFNEAVISRFPDNEKGGS